MSDSKDEIRNAISTPMIVTLWEAVRPIRLPKNRVPNRPAIKEPASGASGTISMRCGLSCPAMKTLFLVSELALKTVEFFYIDRIEVSEQHYENRQSNR